MSDQQAPEPELEPVDEPVAEEVAEPDAEGGETAGVKASVTTPREVVSEPTVVVNEKTS